MNNENHKYSPQQHSKWSGTIVSTFTAHQAIHPIVAACATKVSEAGTFTERDQAFKAAHGIYQDALRQRDDKARELKLEVQRWSALLLTDRPDLYPNDFQGTHRDPRRILQAGKDLLALADGEQPYVADLQAHVGTAVEACEAAIKHADEAATQRREAAAARRQVMAHIEGMLTPFRHMLAGILGKGDPVVMQLRFPRGRKASAETEAGASSVSLVVEPGGPPPQSESEQADELGGALDDSNVAAA